MPLPATAHPAFQDIKLSAATTRVLIHVFPRAFGGLSEKSAQVTRGRENTCLACTEDKCNHYQVFFAVKNYLRICDVNVPS